ncbi:MAG: NAD(P)H-dependent oxidoreductase [Hyphomicrobiales bacterium]|nr:NAD(P)H-dependent oxidoreductase [Hyphomicrobiales bacterium]MBV8825912.1 NAD(P)H-dependent oxidoreductase [Hyphomicrobiales bacterium]MBV9426388.1 NAD(P)H-dependent oxidoreductase [Bradyrhizobiaceae bacterium]
MPIPKILVLAGSIRTGSFNARLAALAAKEIARAEAEVTRISLLDFPLPLYDGDHEARSGAPENAVKLKRMFCAHQGVFIASPEYNASLTPLLKNTIDWLSRVRENKEPALAAYRNRVFALGSASNGTYGGMRSVMALRHVLELGCGALVIPEQIAVREASHAFEENDDLKDERSAALLRTLARRLVELARLVA